MLECMAEREMSKVVYESKQSNHLPQCVYYKELVFRTYGNREAA
jgi:hypothetical protein